MQILPEHLDRDARVRVRAISHFEALRARFGDVLHWEQIAAGLMMDEQRVHLASKACGIHTPARGLCVGALSVRSAVPRSGRKRWYVDAVDDFAGVFEYRHQSGELSNRFNRALRACLHLDLPVIYLRGIAPARYAPIVCFVVEERRADRVFALAPASETDRVRSDILRAAAVLRLPVDRHYALQLTRRRLHQDRFREMVLDAYAKRCAVCRLGHHRLLDAAHITPDHLGGEPVMPNGMALCKLHHAAYDGELLGITPDLEVRIAPTLLGEQDGPVLEHGLKGLHRQRLAIPRARADRPDRDRLAARWAALEWS